MNRRVPAQNLRGSDATLLEVQLQNLLRRPMGQLALINAMDLLALSELESPPRSVVTELARFVERCSTEVAELPPSGMNELLDELGSVEATRVPETFRAWLLRESGRDIRDQSRIREILDGYEGVDPEPFVIGERSAKVEHGAAAGRRGAASLVSHAVLGRAEYVLRPTRSPAAADAAQPVSGGHRSP